MEDFSKWNTEMARQAHENWRAAWRATYGNAPRRLEPTRDRVWQKAHDGCKKLDIAATAFNDLPEDLKGEIEANIRECMAAEISRDSAGLEVNGYFIEFAASNVHSAWVKRNPKLADSKLVSYCELPEIEKEKYRIAMRLFVEA